MVKMGHIKLVQLAPLRPSFPKWYNTCTQCDYHGKNPSHPTKNCTALKYKVRDLINDGKLNFEDWDKPVEVEDSSRTKAEMPKQEEETPKESNVWKTTIPKEKVPTAKASSSSTTEGSKERPYKLDKEEEEKKALQSWVRVWNECSLSKMNGLRRPKRSKIYEP